MQTSACLLCAVWSDLSAVSTTDQVGVFLWLEGLSVCTPRDLSESALYLAILNREAPPHQGPASRRARPETPARHTLSSLDSRGKMAMAFIWRSARGRAARWHMRERVEPSRPWRLGMGGDRSGGLEGQRWDVCTPTHNRSLSLSLTHTLTHTHTQNKC